MRIKVTPDRQITLPTCVLDKLGVKPGDHIELTEGPDGYLLHRGGLDYSRLGTLQDKVSPGHAPLDIRAFRKRPYDPALRD